MTRTGSFGYGIHARWSCRTDTCRHGHSGPRKQTAVVRRSITEPWEIEGLDIFYREAGDPSKPTLVLLHGFPTSSHMFRDLIPMLADEFHLVAPDYPGYGNSSMPSVDEFDYTFDHLADIVETLVGRLGIDRYSLYLMDYGAPVGLPSGGASS